MSAYQNDHDLFQLMKAELFTAVVGDVNGVVIIPHKAEMEACPPSRLSNHLDLCEFFFITT
ncbi:MAG: hypothetical protein H0X30_28085 [Anaerolineae bacterium]|nr:hypothetical protein [Anaerolineae bacterium]